MEMMAFQRFLEGWPYDAENHVRIVFGWDGRKVILVRHPMGLEYCELDRRPDGRCISGQESLFDALTTRSRTPPLKNHPDAFTLGPWECAELFDEALLYHQRLKLLARLKDWVRVERDAARNLRLMEFVGLHARSTADGQRFAPWQIYLIRIHAAARALILLTEDRHRESLEIVRDTPGLAHLPADATDSGNLVAALEECLCDSLAHLSTSPTPGESLFIRQGDFWTIRYRNRTACLKATRGLQCLGHLLRHPDNEFHVSELLVSYVDPPAAPASLRGPGHHLIASGLSGGCPRLDPHAKAEYKVHLNELREDLNEAERANDPIRAVRVQEEMHTIARHLASAVGLGGRDRRASSDAERARCAITKRIKQSIHKISEAIPELGHHLAISIKTGYFCSYAPPPDQIVAWKFEDGSDRLPVPPVFSEVGT